MSYFMVRSSALLIFFVLLFFGCSKSESPAPSGNDYISPEDLLTGKSWTLNAFTADPALDWDGMGYMVSNIFPLMEYCDRDNILLFTDSGKYFIFEGDSSCSIIFPDTAEFGNWWFSSDRDSITKQPLGGNCFKPRGMKIVDLGYNILRLSYTESEQDGLRTYTETYYLK